MYNQEIDRDIVKALCKTFDANKGDLRMYLESDLVDTRDSKKSWIELRYDGPDVTLIKNNNRYKLSVDVFISCPKNEDIYLLDELKGKVKAMFTCIDVYNKSDEFLFTMDIKEGLEVVDYGTIDESRKGCSIRADYIN